MPKSNVLAAAVIGHIFGKSTLTPPTTWYIALCKTLPSASDTGSTISEVTYTNYVRLAITGANLAAVVAQTIASNGTLTFAAPGATGDTANGWALCDAAAAGQMLWFGSLPPTVIVGSGAAPSIPAGSLSFTES